MRRQRISTLVMFFFALAASFVVATPLHADYTTPGGWVDDGNSYWDMPLLEMYCGINGSRARFMVRKIDGSDFNTSGTIYLHLYDSTVIDYTSVPVGQSAIQLEVNLDNEFNTRDFPVYFYAYIEHDNGTWVQVGPVTIDVEFAETYSWKTGSWGDCDNSCGYGEQTRNVYCERDSDGRQVSDGYCSGTKPASGQNCQDYAGCPVENPEIYNVGPSSGTYKIGDHIRITWNTKDIPSDADMKISIKRDSYRQPYENADYKVLTRSAKNTGSVTLSIQDGINPASDWRVWMADIAGQAEAARASGTISISAAEIYSWDTGSWSGCSNTCGDGTKTRAVYCKRNSDGRQVSDSYCSGSKPDTSSSCSDYSECESYFWYTDSWSSCSNDCGSGTQSRNVYCKRSSDGRQVSDGYCSGTKPSVAQDCEDQSGCAETLISTLILVNRQQTEQLYGDAARLMDKLDDLAEHPDVQGLVVQVEDNTTVADAYQNRGENFGDSVEARDQANALAEAIKQQFIIPRQEHLKYIVIVGDDRIIPFYRIIDQACVEGPERTCLDPWTLTDNFYTDMIPADGCEGCDNPNIFVPDIASGRLIETQEQIINFIDNFLTNNVLDITSAAIINDNTPDDPDTEVHEGSQFLEDGAEDQCNVFLNDNIDTNCALIDNNWDANDFIERILEHRHDATSINLHANSYGFGTPDINDDNFVSAGDFQNTETDFSGALFYTLGCHSGQSVAHNTDLPEAIASKGAYYVANTGFGWGGGGIRLSEELLLNFTQLLVEGSEVTLGEVLMEAKQNYHAENRNFDGTDEKVMAESTLYGLPMYNITSPDASPLANGVEANRGEVFQTGLLRRETVSYTLTPKPVTTSEGTFYTLDGTVSGKEGTPILPKLAYDVTNADKKLHGVVFKGGKYSVVKVAPPLQRYHTTDELNSNYSSSSSFTTVGWYPIKFFTHNAVEFSRKKIEKLIVTTGQYNSDDGGRQRIFSSMDFDFYYHADYGDETPPSVKLISKNLQGNVVNLTVSVIDVSGVETVIVAYTDGEGEWKNIELIQNGEIWTGSFPNTDKSEFIIQTVDKFGNVGVNDSETTTFDGGVFTIDSTGLVTIDWLYDGGAYKGELGIFSLEGMDPSVPDLEAFIAEAVARVLSPEDHDGGIVLSDPTDRARFSGVLGGESRDWNEGRLIGLRTFEMNPGDKFALILVPNSTFEALAKNPGTTDKKKRPLFSFTSPNSDYGMHVGQVADISGEGLGFVFEDMEFTNSDKDYNDLIVQINGAVSEIPTIDEMLERFKVTSKKRSSPRDNNWYDWRTNDELGRKIMEHLGAIPGNDELWASVTLDADAALMVYDEKNQFTGKDGGEIPGSFVAFDENGWQTVSLPGMKSDSHNYRVVLRCMGDEPGQLTVKGHEGTAEISLASKEISIEPYQVLKAGLSVSFSEDDLVAGFGDFDVPRASDGTPLTYDFNADGIINDEDIELVSSIWNTCEGDPEYDEFFDFDNDGCISILDITRVVNSKEH
ncbi:DUF4114 domain-containing protein [Desulfococcaceae bacterium HSG8]|nr:DUF4114 domain-containing protein [Desulfococcaceae bacterium HSG8]